MNAPISSYEDPQIYALGYQDRITYAGVHYRCVETTKHGHKLVTEGRPAIEQGFTHGRFQTLLRTDGITVEKQYYSEGSATVRNVWQDLTLSDLPPEKAELAMFYAAFIDEFIRMRHADPKRVSLSTPSLERVLPEIDAHLKEPSEKPRSGRRVGSFNRPQPRHFRRLYKQYVEGGYKAIALAHQERRRRTRLSPFAPHDLQLWNEYATKYAAMRKPLMSTLLRDLEGAVRDRNPERVAAGLPPFTVPKRKFFEKLVHQLNPFFVTAGREGGRAARMKYRITYRGLDVERPLERVEMDEWKVDLSVILADLRTWERLSKAEQKAVKRSRLWLTVAIDCATRCILAMRFSDRAPNGASALSALEMAITDKSLISYVVGTGMPWLAHGEFEHLWTDGGPGFKALPFRTALADLGIGHSRPPAGEPALRPYIETVFKTISTHFLHWFDGRTFSDYLEKGDYDPQENATVCADELNRHLVRAIVDIYHQRHHWGLAEETPHNAWLRLSEKYGVMPPPDSDRRRHIFGISLNRKIGDKGIRFLGLHYNCGDLQALRVQKNVGTVRIRINRFDIGKISVWNDHGWLTVGANHDIPGDVSIWEWIGAARDLEATHQANAERNLSAMFAAINRLRESGEAAYARAEFATPVPDAAAIIALETRHFRSIRYIDDLKSEKVALAPMTYSELPPEGAPSIFPYKWKTDDDELERAPSVNNQTIDPYDEDEPDSNQSQFGGIGTLRFQS